MYKPDLQIQVGTIDNKNLGGAWSVGRSRDLVSIANYETLR